MTQISFKAIKEQDLTIGDLIKISQQARQLPQGFKITYKKPVENYAEKLVEDLK